jgi:hypothetical protein
LYTSHEVEVKVLVAEEEVGICFKMEYYPPTNIDQKYPKIISWAEDWFPNMDYFQGLC